MHYDDICLCFTMGGRPSLLRRSIESLQQIGTFAQVIAVNDFSDPVCDEIFKFYYPDGILLSDGQRRGHHGAIDWLYENVKTKYVFHTEDDWVFDKEIDLIKAKYLLDSESHIVSYCFRSPSDFLNKDQWSNAKEFPEYWNLSSVHDEWYSYSFNPHLIKKCTLENIAPFSKYKKERHVSRAMKQNLGFVAYCKLPIAVHIGDEISMANPNAHKKKSWLRRQGRRLINAIKSLGHSQS